MCALNDEYHAINVEETNNFIQYVTDDHHTHYAKSGRMKRTSVYRINRIMVGLSEDFFHTKHVLVPKCALTPRR